MTKRARTGFETVMRPDLFVDSGQWRSNGVDKVQVVLQVQGPPSSKQMFFKNTFPLQWK